MPTSYTHNTLEFTGVTVEQVNSSSFGLKFEYPINNSTNTGRMCLGNVYIELVVKTPNVILSATTSNNNVILNEVVTVNFNVERVGDADYAPVLEIDIPSGLTYQSNTGHGSITQADSVLTWKSSFDGRSKNTIAVKFKCTSAGTHTLEMHDTLTSNSYQLKINVSNITLSATTTLNSTNTPIKATDTVEYSITLKTNTTQAVTLSKVYIDLPGSARVASFPRSYTTSITDTQMRIILSNVSVTSALTLTFQITFNQALIGTQEISVIRSGSTSEESLLITPVLVQSDLYGTLGFTRIRVPDEYTSAMGDNITYRLMSVCRHIIDSTNVNLTDWKNNVRIGIYNSWDAIVDDSEEFLLLTQWADKISTKKWTEYYVDFKYDADNPLYIVFSLEYTGNPIFDVTHFEFSQPILVEKQYWGLVDYFKPFPVPVTALCNNTDYAVVTLPKLKDTAPVICYDWNGLSPLADTDLAIRGITLSLDYTVSKDVELQVTVSAEDTKTYEDTGT